jgi:hypothetical protein
MPLNLTKIAFGCASLDILNARLAARGTEARLTTRYRPKRAEEMTGGSLYWILASHIVARSPIIRFDEAEGGKTDIVIEARTIAVHPVPRRAHQGWRYLEAADAPRDLADGATGAEDLPPEMLSNLAALGLV